MSNVSHPIAILAPIAATSRTGARFASFTYTAKKTGEKAKHRLALGVSVENAYKRDIAILSSIRPTLEGVAVQACDELIASLRTSLEKGIGNNPDYTCADTYVHVAKGIKAHKETGEVYVSGFTLGKTVIEKGVYPKANSSAKTLAKEALKKRMKSGRFRQFSITELHSATMNGATLSFE